MKNVLRATLNGKDGRLNLEKGILTFYSNGKPEKWDILKNESTEILREFLNLMLIKGLPVGTSIFHPTDKNSFNWDCNGLSRLNDTDNTFSWLKPNTKFTKAVLSAMVRAHVK